MKIKKLKEIIDTSNHIVFFTGAGISVPSGIPDFRSSTGLYNQNLRAEEILSHHFFIHHPDEFYDYYFKNLVYKDALPNKAHHFIASLQKDKKITVITQNIDGFDLKAGSSNVYELHGSIHRNHCMKCHKSYHLDEITDQTLPTCLCGGLIKPDVVLYEEALDESVIDGAIQSILKADALIIIGTSLNVYPAASFVRYYQKDKLVIINKEITGFDHMADLVINDDIIHVIDELNKLD